MIMNRIWFALICFIKQISDNKLNLVCFDMLYLKRFDKDMGAQSPALNVDILYKR